MFINQIFAAVAQYWFVTFVVGIASWLVKNKFSNGLNKYPGPTLAGFTNWWRFYDAWGRNAHHTHIKLHKQHGDIVRLGPNILSFADPKAIKDIYGLNKGYTKVGNHLDESFFGVNVLTYNSCTDSILPSPKRHVQRYSHPKSLLHGR